MTTKISVVMEEDECVALQRISYEIKTAQTMIDLYTGICKKYNSPELLGSYITKYDQMLPNLIAHKELLATELMNKYFPYDKIPDKDKAKYRIDVEEGVVYYYYGE